MKNWIINSQHHSNSHADCWTMRGIFPPVSFFFFFYFYPHTEGLHQCPVFFPKCDPMKQWIYRGYTPTKTTHKVSTSHCPSLPKKNILKKHCKYDYSKNQTKQHQQKKIIIIKKERVHDYFPPTLRCWQSAYCVETWAGDHLSTCRRTNIKNWERGAREERRGRWFREHHSSSLSDVCQPLGGEHR